MPSLIDETWEWLDGAEQAREVAGLLADQGPSKPCCSSPKAMSGWRELPAIQH